MIGSQINQYKILEKIGSARQGTVYKALDTKLNRQAVIKILPADLTKKTANFKRFEREAQLCSQLDHPNICTIYDFSDSDGVVYIAMQYVEGKNVRQLVAGRPLELKSALSIAIQVTDALAYAHSKNIIHRDIKAGNIMVTDAGQVKILDFGLAKLLEDEHASINEGYDIQSNMIPVDFNTSGRSWAQQQADKELQATFYLAALNQAGLVQLPARFEYIVLVKNKTPKIQRFVTERKASDVFALFNLVGEVYRAMTKDVFLPNPTGWSCAEKYCSFWAECPQGGKG